MPTSAKLPRARPDPQRVKFPRMNNLITDSIFAWIDRVLQSFRPSPAALTDMRLGPEDNPNNPLMVTCPQNDTHHLAYSLSLAAIFHMGCTSRGSELVEAS